VGAAELAHGLIEPLGLLEVAYVTCVGDHHERGVRDRPFPGSLLAGFVAFDAPGRTRFAWQMLTAPAIGVAAGLGALTLDPGWLAVITMGSSLRRLPSRLRSPRASTWRR
jgi:hypothetical protein